MQRPPARIVGVPQPDDLATDAAAAFLDLHLRRSVILGPNAGWVGSGGIRGHAGCHKQGGQGSDGRGECAMLHKSTSSKTVAPTAQMTPAIFKLTPPVPNRAFIRPLYGSAALGLRHFKALSPAPVPAIPFLPGSPRRPCPLPCKPKSGRDGRPQYATAWRELPECGRRSRQKDGQRRCSSL